MTLLTRWYVRMYRQLVKDKIIVDNFVNVAEQNIFFFQKLLKEICHVIEHI